MRAIACPLTTLAVRCHRRAASWKLDLSVSSRRVWHRVMASVTETGVVEALRSRRSRLHILPGRVNKDSNSFRLDMGGLWLGDRRLALGIASPPRTVEHPRISGTTFDYTISGGGRRSRMVSQHRRLDGQSADCPAVDLFSVVFRHGYLGTATAAAALGHGHLICSWLTLISHPRTVPVLTPVHYGLMLLLLAASLN